MGPTTVLVLLSFLTTTTTANLDLHIMGLLPQSGTSAAEDLELSRGIWPAVELALRHVNEGGILKKHRLNIHWQDTEVLSSGPRTRSLRFGRELSAESSRAARGAKRAERILRVSSPRDKKRWKGANGYIMAHGISYSRRTQFVYLFYA